MDEQLKGKALYRSCVGRKIYSLTVLEYIGVKNGYSHFLVECDCKEKVKLEVACYNLICGNTRSCGHLRRKDISGQVFNELTALHYLRSNDRGDAIWYCQCSCGNFTEVRINSLISGDIKSCGHLLKQTPACWKGKELLSGQYWSNLKYGGKKRKLEWDIDVEYGWELFEKQDRKCALTGLPIVLIKNLRPNRHLQTASLDREDNDKGYIKGNVRWTHWRTNIMKSDMTDDELYFYCKKIVELYEEKNKTYEEWWKKEPEDTSYICSI